MTQSRTQQVGAVDVEDAEQRELRMDPQNLSCHLPTPRPQPTVWDHISQPLGSAPRAGHVLRSQKAAQTPLPGQKREQAAGPGARQAVARRGRRAGAGSPWSAKAGWSLTAALRGPTRGGQPEPWSAHRQRLGDKPAGSCRSESRVCGHFLLPPRLDDLHRRWRPPPTMLRDRRAGRAHQARSR